jgi:GNAT superfamily N-acetyltransferase
VSAVRLVGLEDAIGRARESAPAGTAVTGIGWSTVDLERAERELGLAFQDAVPDAILGARTRINTEHLSVPLVLLEPATEGRLAASLARLGEGPVVTWLAGPAPTAGPAGPAGPPALGPFGEERLDPGPIHGPYRLFLTPVTIRTMNDPAVTIRSASATDADAIARLFTDEGYPAGPSDIVERLSRFQSPYSQVLVAEHEGAVIGFIAIHALPRFEHDDRIVRILALVVDAGARERGVGRTLIAEAERISLELGAAFVEITAGHHRPEARQLYETLGYDASVAAYLRKKL